MDPIEGTVSHDDIGERFLQFNQDGHLKVCLCDFHPEGGVTTPCKCHPNMIPLRQLLHHGVRCCLIEKGKDGDYRYSTELQDENERLLAAQASIKYHLARLVDNAGPVSPGCDPQSWGAGFQTAHQMALNIMNKAFEQNDKDKPPNFREMRGIFKDRA